MKSYIYKGLFVAVLAVGFFSNMLAAPVAYANDVAKPRIRSIENVQPKSALLQFKWNEYKNKKNVDTKVKVRIENLATGAVTFQLFDTRVNGNGRGKVTLMGLNPNTNYAFKIKVRKITLDDYSEYSSRKTVTTMKAPVAAATAEPAQ